MNEKCNKRILTDNGYAVPDSAGGYDYYYYVKDWQGNVRAVIDEANRRMELNSYYPYGMPMSSTASVQPYKYGGKELDRTNGLDMSCRYAYLLRRMRKFVGCENLFLLSICIIFTIQLIRIVDEKDCGTFMRVVGDDGIAGV